ncbi:hypothetical protein BV25DRAFT_1793562 [Artomyces pyxidatus]|uniref:Uncharacterized protein n=1 Tax=Artomyces pyxidatus TaxID=48021 RepID=A0ACB8TIS2_9AGAM|nr:hypothetical protein BV25DRAFT_1793562 [Artomyces pyxidatus]
MSRPPPFPTASARRPGPNGTESYSTNSNTKPLQINRAPPRPTTPSNGSVISAPASPTGPARPQRSELRNIQSSEYAAYDNASASRPRNSSASTARSDASAPNGYRTRNGSTSTTASNRPKRPMRTGTMNTVGTEESEMSPTSLASVMSAFQSAGARKRTMDANGDDEWELERQKAVEAERQRQKRIKDKVPGRRVNGKAKAGDIDAVLDRIKDEWEFVIDPEFNPVDLALQILDESSSGKDMNSFRRTKLMLSQALKGSVDKHYQAFAAALPHHSSLLNHLGTTQDQIKGARAALQESKDALGQKRADLVQMWTRGQTLEEMLRILDQIERLKLVPDVLESLMSEKRLLQAAVLLVRSLKTINKQDMLDVGAVADLRGYLNGQEAALREILIDELHNHLYLKSFWCEIRWAAYTVNQQSMPKVEFEDEPLISDSYSQPPPATPTSPATPASPSARPTRLSRYLHNLALRPNDPPDDLEEPSFRSSTSASGIPSNGSSSNLPTGLGATGSLTSLTNLANGPQGGSVHAQNRNPETDSFTYIETLLESLAVLGKLGSALDIVSQRLPSEIFSLVEATVDEVGERAEYGRRSSLLVSNAASPHTKAHSAYIFASKPAVTSGLGMDIPSALLGPSRVGKGSLMSALQLRLSALESSAKHVDHEVLRDMFWTLYSKLDAVMQGLRVVYEVANRIGSRRDFKDSTGAKPGSLFPLAEIWMPVQGEVRTLLNDYLTDEEQGVMSGRNPISSINDVLREGRFSRDKSKHVFRFADTDLKQSIKALRTHEDELNRVLRDTVPGLVQGSSETAVQATLSTVGTDERLLGADQHHRLLVKPDAFHVSVLFQPMLAFMDRVAEVLPSGLEAARASSAVMEEFVLKVYLPQLEEKVSLLFHQAVTGSDAFQPDPSSFWLSSEPLINASTQLMALINSLCAMLRTTPFHRDNYARLILTVVIQFYQRCSDRFQALVTTNNPQNLEIDPVVASAAQWAQRSDMNVCLSDLYNTPEHDIARRRELCRREREIEAEIMGDNSVSKENLVTPLRNISALSNLYRSVAWFSAALNQLKAVPGDSISPTSPQRMEPVSAVTPFTPYLPSLVPITADEQLQLPLSREMALRFHALLKTYEQLSELILHTIRIDIRCRGAHYLDLALRHGNYRIDREVGEPDPHVIDLNIELGEFDDIISTALPTPAQRFVFDGLGILMEDLLIANARHIRFANMHGIKKINRNMLALQQCIKTVARDDQDTEFERAKQYYALFTMAPGDMLASIRKRQVFSIDEYKVILNLMCGVDQSQAGSSAPQASDKNYNMYVIELHGLEWEDKTERS